MSINYICLDCHRTMLYNAKRCICGNVTRKQLKKEHPAIRKSLNLNTKSFFSFFNLLPKVRNHILNKKSKKIIKYKDLLSQRLYSMMEGAGYFNPECPEGQKWMIVSDIAEYTLKHIKEDEDLSLEKVLIKLGYVARPKEDKRLRLTISRKSNNLTLDSSCG